MKRSYALLLAALLPLGACAQAPANAPVAQAVTPGTAAIANSDPRVALAAKIPGTKPADLRATPVPGIFELAHGGDITYVSADAKYLFAGDLYLVSDKGDFPNLSENRRRELRLNLLGDVPESQMLVFGPDKAAHTVTVFTDIDCPWCRKLHSQMADYNKLGIRVRYLFYPRTGPNTESWVKAEAVWCSADRKDAFTRAKLGQVTSAPHCANTPIAREFKLGQDIGISGTPGMVLESGELIPGYLAPPDLMAHLQQAAARPVLGAPASPAR